MVNRKGILYKVDLFDKYRKLIPAGDLQKLLCWIMHDADKHQGKFLMNWRSLASCQILPQYIFWCKNNMKIVVSDLVICTYEKCREEN